MPDAASLREDAERCAAEAQALKALSRINAVDAEAYALLATANAALANIEDEMRRRDEDQDADRG